jgi:nucleotide-binding universal stress UspA family protein
LKFAVSIAERSNGEICLIHVVDLPVMSDPMITTSLYVGDLIVKESAAHAEKSFNKLITKYKSKGIRFKTSVEYGNPTMAILSVIEEKKADLVVMGTKGASGLKEVFIGSNTEKIVRGSRVPVLSIPKSTLVRSIKNIVFSNSLREENEKLTLAVKAMQDFFKATLHIVFVNTPGFFKRDHETIGRLNTYAKRYMFKNYTIQVYNDISEQEGTLAFAAEVNADIIAMGTHGRRGLAHLFTGSIAEDVVNHVQCPMWTYRSK